MMTRQNFLFWSRIFWASFSINERISFYMIEQIFSGDIREGELPDPIPNSEVKPFFADGTTLKSVEE